jgi:hypothetical protein
MPLCLITHPQTTINSKKHSKKNIAKKTNNKNNTKSKQRRPTNLQNESKFF